MEKRSIWVRFRAKFEDFYKWLYQTIDYPPNKTLGGLYMNGPVIVEPEKIADKRYIIQKTAERILHPYGVKEVIVVEESAIFNLSDPKNLERFLNDIKREEYRKFEPSAEVIATERPVIDPDLLLKSRVGT
jgi:arginyl-tRNA synthetase